MRRRGPRETDSWKNLKSKMASNNDTVQCRGDKTVEEIPVCLHLEIKSIW